VRNVLHQLNDALAGAALSREQAGLIEWHAIFDRPLAFRDRLAVPVRHVEPRQLLQLTRLVVEGCAIFMLRIFALDAVAAEAEP
jgi:hypothetical protein